MIELTEGKNIGSRKAWGNELQGIAIHQNQIAGLGPPSLLKPMADEGFQALKGEANDALQAVLARYREGELTKGQFEAQAKGVIRSMYERSYSLGAQRMGAPVGLELDRQDLAWLKSARTQEYTFLGRFADAIEDETYVVDPVDRMELYSDTIESMYWAGEISTMPDNAEIVWNLGDSEHCQDCLELAAGGPYTRKTLPTTPRAGSTQCLTACKCYLTTEYPEAPEIEKPPIKVWKPMREFDDWTPPRGMRAATASERTFIDNVGLRIRFEKNLADAGTAPEEHGNLAAGLAGVLAAYLAARQIWAPPTWNVPDDDLVTGDEFEEAFDEDSFDMDAMAELSDEDFDAILSAWEERIPADVPKKAKKMVAQAVKQTGVTPEFEDKTRQTMRLLLEYQAEHGILVEYNPWHDRLGRFTFAAAADGGGAYGGTATIPRGGGKWGQLTFEHGPEDEMELPAGKELSVAYNVDSGHLGWIDRAASHNALIGRFKGFDRGESDRYAHITIYPPVVKGAVQGVEVRSPWGSGSNRLKEARELNRIFAMLRQKGFPAETRVKLVPTTGHEMALTLGDTVQLEQRQIVQALVAEILPAYAPGVRDSVVE